MSSPFRRFPHIPLLLLALLPLPGCSALNTAEPNPLLIFAGQIAEGSVHIPDNPSPLTPPLPTPASTVPPHVTHQPTPLFVAATPTRAEPPIDSPW